MIFWGLSYFLSRKQGWLVDLALNQSRQTLNLGLDPAWYHLWRIAACFWKCLGDKSATLGKLTAKAPENWCLEYNLPSRELTYPTWGKGKSSSKVPWKRDMLVPWRVPLRLLKFPLLRCYDVCFREGFSHIPWVPWPPSQDAMPVISMKVSVAGFP